MYYEHPKGNMDWKTTQKNPKRQLKFVLLCFVPLRKKSHSSQNEYLDINVDGLEHYKQPTDLLEQAI